MPIIVRQFTLDVTITGKANLFALPVTQSTPFSLGDVMLHKWIVRIPNGHAGLTGVALLQAGVAIVPYGNPSTPFIVGNDSLFEFPVEAEVDRGLTIAQSNNDILPHTHYMIFEYTPIAAYGTPAPVVLSAVPIS